MLDYYLKHLADIHNQQRIILLDRDGNINEDQGTYCYQPISFIWIKAVKEALIALHRNHYAIVIVTNQGGIAKGLFKPEDVDRVHNCMLAELPKNVINAIIYSPSSQKDYHWAKPNIGMFDVIKQQYAHANWQNAAYVGDKQSDLEAAQRSDLTPILVRTGYGQDTEAIIKQQPSFFAFTTFDDLPSYVNHLLKHQPS